MLNKKPNVCYLLTAFLREKCWLNTPTPPSTTTPSTTFLTTTTPSTTFPPTIPTKPKTTKSLKTPKPADEVYSKGTTTPMLLTASSLIDAINAWIIGIVCAVVVTVLVVLVVCRCRNWGESTIFNKHP